MTFKKNIFPRITRQREMLLSELMSLDTHPTADELFERLRRRLPHISLATVYRNLEALAASGTIRKLETCGRQARYDGNASPHAHVRCVRCGRIDDVKDVETGCAGPLPRELSGYKIVGRHIEYDGICPRCRSCEKQSDNPKNEVIFCNRS
ncbi:MAG: transcriptional repressor [Deltaproteobacteria bacterium]